MEAALDYEGHRSSGALAAALAKGPCFRLLSNHARRPYPKVHQDDNSKPSPLNIPVIMAEVENEPATTAPETVDLTDEPSTSTRTDIDITSTSQTLTTTNAEGKKVKKIIRRKRRPARPQVDPATFKKDAPPPTGTIFNIWYNKWSGGDREDSYLNKTAAQSRCVIARDSGYTKADRTPGAYFCLFFARGLCPKGVDCE